MTYPHFPFLPRVFSMLASTESSCIFPSPSCIKIMVQERGCLRLRSTMDFSQATGAAATSQYNIFNLTKSPAMPDSNAPNHRNTHNDDGHENNRLNYGVSDIHHEALSSDSGLGSQDSSPESLSSQSSESSGDDYPMEDVSQPPEEPNVSRPTELDSYNNPTRAEVLLPELAMHRYFTFPKDWNQAVPKLDLANSGFFFNHAQDAIQCFFCKVKISGYMNTSNVNTKHRELCPSCPLMTSAPSCSNIPIGDVTSYRYEANRLFSLLTTNWTAPIDVYDLAKSGFYWTGTSDNCRCVFCRLEVRGWETGDTADGEHRRWNSSCVFLNGRTVGNVPIGLELSPPPLANDEAGSMPMEQLGVTPINPPRHAEYMTYAKRVDSFRLWPLCMPQRPEQLAEAGFYYTGTGDRVICFQCGGGLKDWAENDCPWEEHAKWFSKCAYLLLKKGQAYITGMTRATPRSVTIQAAIEAAKHSQAAAEAYKNNSNTTIDSPNAARKPAVPPVQNKGHRDGVSSVWSHGVLHGLRHQGGQVPQLLHATSRIYTFKYIQ
ncbi:hypothetical protein B566_EDAN015964, partial [Ephemera danica]